MADVFVSYSRQDAAFVQELLAFLEEKGRDTWVARSAGTDGRSQWEA